MSQALDGLHSAQPVNLVPDEILQDLKNSGLGPKDLRIRRLDNSERAATNCGPAARGYVIPYFEIDGSMQPFYRVKILNPEVEGGVKYKQPRKTPNHIYFPSGLKACLARWLSEHSGRPMLIITEGEKKAAAAVRNGLPCVALGGVDSWRSKTIELPLDTELTANKKAIRARLPASDVSVPEMQQLAQGFASLMDLVIQFNLTLVIVFDSDRHGTLKAEVQRAATMLAYELRYLGVPSARIKQLILPDVFEAERSEAETDVDTGVSLNPEDIKDLKTGLDDYLLVEGVKPLLPRLFEVLADPAAFPKHPNPKGFLNVQLNGILDRRSLMQISSVLLSELDAQGMRFKEVSSGKPYYFDRATYNLIPAQILSRSGEVMHETAFGTMLYRKFGLTGTDQKVLSWLASQFTGEEPIRDVTPRRIRTLITNEEDPFNPHGLAIQASDSHYFAVSPDPRKPVELCTNGDKGILFEQDQVSPLDYDRTLDLFDQFIRERHPMESWWLQVLEETNLGKHIGEELEDGTREGYMDAAGVRMRQYAALLFYISPFLQRWRGTQLPVEIMLGEAGSGKSSIYDLRLQILTGRPHLRNIPQDIKDWNASITNSGGLVAFDNVHFTKRDVKQIISDEVCRLITEPNPHVELRRYYTTAELMRIPVDVTFAFTAIQQPFQNADLFQRSAIFELVKLGQAPDGDWVTKQLEKFGGREAWVAHHLVFLHRFLRITSREGLGGWDPSFPTQHRLAHFEQCLKIASNVLGISQETEVPVGQVIREAQERTLTEADWTFEALSKFAEYMRTRDINDRRFFAKDVIEWALGEPDYSDNRLVTNSRALGRYLTSHSALLRDSLGITYIGKVMNAMRYKVTEGASQKRE